MTEDFLETDQVDPATIEDSNLDRVEPVGPHRLYVLWEKQHWATSALDFTHDREHWIDLHENQRSMLTQSVATFFAGEERIAAAFAPIILSAENGQETACLATQQVDEARHTEFFEKFWREVVCPDDGGRAAIDDARARCNEAFAELFDRRLMQPVNRLQANPRDIDAKVETIALYHLVIEGMMGLTGLHFLLDYVVKNSILCALASGLRNVLRDEHRHVAYGTWFLRRTCREQDRYGFIVQRTLMEALPIAAGVLVEGGQAVCDGLDPVEFLEYSSAEVNQFALVSLSRRLKVIGGATDEIQRFVASAAWRASRVV